MSNQITINKKLVDYLQKVGYRSDKITDQLIQETQVLGNVAQMQIAPEQGQFLEMLVKISKTSKCLEIGRFTGLSTLYIAKGLPDDGKVTTIDISDEFLDLSIKSSEFPISANGKLLPSNNSSAKSEVLSTPIISASYSSPPDNVTVIFEEFSTTCVFVKTYPSGLITTPLPELCIG